MKHYSFSHLVNFLFSSMLSQTFHEAVCINEQIKVLSGFKVNSREEK